MELLTALTTSGVLDLTGTTDSSDASGDTGILRVEGGASIAKKLYIGTDLDVDGTANLDVVDIDGAVNIATTALITGVLTTTATPIFNGGFTANEVCTISVDDNDAGLTLTSTDADANKGPVLKMFRDSSSPADDDLLGAIDFNGEQSNGNEHNYASISVKAKDIVLTAGTEDGDLIFSTSLAGANTEHIAPCSRGTFSLLVKVTYWCWLSRLSLVN